jgi:vancomycin resistance protein VanW
MFLLPFSSFLMVGLPLQTDFTRPRTKTEVHTLVSEEIQSMIPAHLFLPPNPPAPGRTESVKMGMPYLLSERTTNYYHAKPSQAKNIELVAHRLNGIVLQPGEIFSYNKSVGPYTTENGFGWGRAFDGDRIVPSLAGGVCQGASTLYSALLHTSLHVVERHHHGMTVPYLPAGEDATVAESVHYDFRFQNNQTRPIRITAQALPDKRFLTIAIWGAKPAEDILVHHHMFAEYPFETIEKATPDHKSAKVLFPGQDGGIVDTQIEIHDQKSVRNKIVSQDTYLPSPRIVD